MRWQASAACAGHPTPDLWYDDSHTEEARQICRGCPVTQPCLVDALERGDHHGVWGGTVPDQRRQLLRLARTIHRQEPAA